MKKKGFTLVELIVVIAILAVLMMLIVPQITGYLQKAKEQTAKSNARVVVQTVQIEYADQYILGNLMNKVNLPGTDILNRIYEYSNAKGTVSSITADAKNDIEHLVYQEGDITVTYCRDYHTHSTHDALYNITEYANSVTSIWMKDANTGQYVELEALGNYMDAEYPKDSKGYIVYYNGSNGPEGYYIIRNGALNTANAVHNYIGKSYGAGGVTLLNTDKNIETYDFNKKATGTTGQVYYVDFPWDDVDGPVLAYLRGYGGQGVDQSTSKYHGDLTDETQKEGWIILGKQ